MSAPEVTCEKANTLEEQELADLLGHDDLGHKALMLICRHGIKSPKALAEQSEADLQNIRMMGSKRWERTKAARDKYLALSANSGEARSAGASTIEILRVNSDGEDARNEHGQKTTVVDVEVSGMGSVRLLIHHDVASALYRAVCEE